MLALTPYKLSPHYCERPLVGQAPASPQHRKRHLLPWVSVHVPRNTGILRNSTGGGYRNNEQY
jgi:hypothetical protein